VVILALTSVHSSNSGLQTVVATTLEEATVGVTILEEVVSIVLARMIAEEIDLPVRFVVNWDTPHQAASKDSKQITLVTTMTAVTWNDKSLLLLLMPMLARLPHTMLIQDGIWTQEPLITSLTTLTSSR
jgi:hypothetical protein